MSQLTRNIRHLCTLAAAAVCTCLVACSDGTVADDQTAEPTDPAQALMAQFGDGSEHFSASGLQALLDFEDTASPVVLLQLTGVDDPAGFARYEDAVGSVWMTHGGRERFASRVIGEIIGDRGLTEVRGFTFPNAPALVDAMRTEEFAAAAELLFAATSGHAWVLGVDAELGVEFSGGFFDPSLLFLDEEDAIELLAANAPENANPGEGLAANPQPIIDMIVSDSPEPFYMVNLIDFYEQANYPDGRDSDLTGREANDIYGQAILPMLFAHNSGPEILIPVSVVLTKEERAWEQAVIVRYASRDAFLNVFNLNPDANAALEHKDAGVEETLVYVTERRHRTPPEPTSGILYEFRYCEIVLSSDGIEFEIWGTQGISFCPQEAWDALDPNVIAEENGAAFVVMNGPRFFLMDWTSGSPPVGGGERKMFGDLEMTRFTTARLPGVGEGAPYSITRVARNNVWHFVAGRRVYELIDPTGTRYVMQSLSRIVDPDLTIEELATLGDRLVLPDGWQFESRLLTETLDVPAIDGTAELVTDDLSNTYQRIP